MERKILVAVSTALIIACAVLFFRECEHYINDSIKIDYLKKERELIRHEKDSITALLIETKAKINHDSIYQRIEKNKNHDIQKFDNRVHDIVGMAVNSTAAEIEANISKGDSIKRGHLNLVNPR